MPGLSSLLGLGGLSGDGDALGGLGGLLGGGFKINYQGPGTSAQVGSNQGEQALLAMLKKMLDNQNGTNSLKKTETVLPQPATFAPPINQGSVSPFTSPGFSPLSLRPNIPSPGVGGGETAFNRFLGGAPSLRF